MPFEAKFLNLSSDNYRISLVDPTDNQIKESIELSETENKKINCAYDKLTVILTNLTNTEEELTFDLPECELYTIDMDFSLKATIIKSDKQGKRFEGVPKQAEKNGLNASLSKLKNNTVVVLTEKTLQETAGTTRAADTEALTANNTSLNGIRYSAMQGAAGLHQIITVPEKRETKVTFSNASEKKVYYTPGTQGARYDGLYLNKDQVSAEPQTYVASSTSAYTAGSNYYTPSTYLTSAGNSSLNVNSASAAAQSPAVTANYLNTGFDADKFLSDLFKKESTTSASAASTSSNAYGTTTQYAMSSKSYVDTAPSSYKYYSTGDQNKYISNSSYNGALNAPSSLLVSSGNTYTNKYFSGSANNANANATASASSNGNYYSSYSSNNNFEANNKQSYDLTVESSEQQNKSANNYNAAAVDSSATIVASSNPNYASASSATTYTHTLDNFDVNKYLKELNFNASATAANIVSSGQTNFIRGEAAAQSQNTNYNFSFKKSKYISASEYKSNTVVLNDNSYAANDYTLVSSGNTVTPSSTTTITVASDSNNAKSSFNIQEVSNILNRYNVNSTSSSTATGKYFTSGSKYYTPSEIKNNSIAVDNIKIVSSGNSAASVAAASNIFTSATDNKYNYLSNSVLKTNAAEVTNVYNTYTPRNQNTVISYDNFNSNTAEIVSAKAPLNNSSRYKAAGEFTTNTSVNVNGPVSSYLATATFTEEKTVLPKTIVDFNLDDYMKNIIKDYHSVPEESASAAVVNVLQENKVAELEESEPLLVACAVNTQMNKVEIQETVAVEVKPKEKQELVLEVNVEEKKENVEEAQQQQQEEKVLEKLPEVKEPEKTEEVVLAAVEGEDVKQIENVEIKQEAAQEVKVKEKAQEEVKPEENAEAKSEEKQDIAKEAEPEAKPEEKAEEVVAAEPEAKPEEKAEEVVAAEPEAKSEEKAEEMITEKITETTQEESAVAKSEETQDIKESTIVETIVVNKIQSEKQPEDEVILETKTEEELKENVSAVTQKEETEEKNANATPSKSEETEKLAAKESAPVSKSVSKTNSQNASPDIALKKRGTMNFDMNHISLDAVPLEKRSSVVISEAVSRKVSRKSTAEKIKSPEAKSSEAPTGAVEEFELPATANKKEALALNFEKINAFYSAIKDLHKSIVGIISKNNEFNASGDLFACEAEKEISFKNNSAKTVFVRVSAQSQDQEKIVAVEPKASAAFSRLANKIYKLQICASKSSRKGPVFKVFSGCAYAIDNKLNLIDNLGNHVALSYSKFTESSKAQANVNNKLFTFLKQENFNLEAYKKLVNKSSICFINATSEAVSIRIKADENSDSDLILVYPAMALLAQGKPETDFLSEIKTSASTSSTQRILKYNLQAENVYILDEDLTLVKALYGNEIVEAAQQTSKLAANSSSRRNRAETLSEISKKIENEKNYKREDIYFIFEEAEYDEENLNEFNIENGSGEDVFVRIEFKGEGSDDFFLLKTGEDVWFLREDGLFLCEVVKADLTSKRYIINTNYCYFVDEEFNLIESVSKKLIPKTLERFAVGHKLVCGKVTAEINYANNSDEKAAENENKNDLESEADAEAEKLVYFKDVKPKFSRGKKFVDEAFPAKANSLTAVNPLNKRRLEGNNPHSIEKIDENVLSSVAFKRPEEILKKDQSMVLFNENSSAENTEQTYLASIIDCLQQNPALIRRCFKTQELNKEGFYEIFYYENGVKKLIFVDDQLPVLTKEVKANVEKFYFSELNTSEIWLPLLEKAYAKYEGGYANIQDGNVLSEIHFLTGALSYKYSTKEDLSEKAIWENLLASANNSALVLAGYNEVEANSKTKETLCQIAYTVLSSYEFDDGKEIVKLVKVKNPHGHFEWSGHYAQESEKWTAELKSFVDAESAFNETGVFFLSFVEFVDQFDFFVSTFAN